MKSKQKGKTVMDWVSGGKHGSAGLRLVSQKEGWVEVRSPGTRVIGSGSEIAGLWYERKRACCLFALTPIFAWHVQGTWEVAHSQSEMGFTAIFTAVR